MSQAIAARIHDAAIEDGIFKFLATDEAKAVGIMGGHDVPRGADAFEKIALMTRELRRQGLKIISGGGPGLMEAANFGAFMAPYKDADFDLQLKTLRVISTEFLRSGVRSAVTITPRDLVPE